MPLTAQVREALSALLTAEGPKYECFPWEVDLSHCTVTGDSRERYDLLQAWRHAAWSMDWEEVTLVEVYWTSQGGQIVSEGHQTARFVHFHFRETNDARSQLERLTFSFKEKA